MAVKPLKKFVTVAYVYEVQADTQKGIDYVIKELRSTPTFRFVGGGDFGTYSASLANKKGKVIKQ